MLIKPKIRSISGISIELFYMIFFAFLFMLSACSQQATPREESINEETNMNTPLTSTNRDETPYFIFTSAQLTVDDNLRIGAGNVWEEEYSNEDGETVHGLTAGMWFFVRNQPDLNQHMRVHEKQTIEIAEYTIKVTDIESEGVGVSILTTPARP